MHYLLALCAPPDSPIRQEAIALAAQSFGDEHEDYRDLLASVPSVPVFRAVAKGRSEPLNRTIARALVRGAESFWSGKQAARHDLARLLFDWESELDDDGFEVSDRQILSLLADLTREADTDMVLVIDELGKNLEYAARHRGTSDLYLLQQIAELKLKGKHQVYFVGVLHQEFAGYSDRLSGRERNEWSKVQGRFENVAFSESPNQMTRLLGRSIKRSGAVAIAAMLETQAQAWLDRLDPVVSPVEFPASVLAKASPLHPLTAIILPELCLRYAQNDRSLFAFMTSDEPNGFKQFLQSVIVTVTTETGAETGAETETGKQLSFGTGTGAGAIELPTLQLHQVYDYFVETASGMASRLNLQRWVEVQTLIRDARTQDESLLRLLKTIGILNLVTTGGHWRASPELVAAALCDRPDDHDQQLFWLDRIEAAKRAGILTHRQLVNELRIWEGSDFNVEKALDLELEADRVSLVDLLRESYPLKPQVAQRHYTETGTLRYFERMYADRATQLGAVTCVQVSTDGVIVYWLDRELPTAVPAMTADGKPLVVVSTESVEVLSVRARELRALQRLLQGAAELTTDRVARKEVQFRIAATMRLVEETIAQMFDWSVGRNCCWLEGECVAVTSERVFRSQLSNICDRVYGLAWRIENELIDRRLLTAQGAKARRVLLEAMLISGDRERLGLEGFGPEVSMYYSVLKATGVHRCEGDRWGFFPPLSESGLATVWSVIEAFCLSATVTQRSLAELYAELAAPPYGLKDGAIPVVIAAVLFYHVDDVGLYKDGTFIPLLGSEHFELLVKDPSRFAVKYFEIAGLRSSVFQDLERMLRSPGVVVQAGVRNASLLMVAKPLFRFAKRLPKYTLRTSRLSSEARAVLRELQNAQEPDDLLFRSLPMSCGFAAFEVGVADDPAISVAFRGRLLECLQEIQTAYDRLLSECQVRLQDAFAVRSEGTVLRQDLARRSVLLVEMCVEPVLKRFLLAAIDDRVEDREWVEAVSMVVADKPPRAWLDADVLGFEVALSDLARRFVNLEALCADRSMVSAGDEALRLTVTRADGREVNRLVWIDRCAA
jgi:hypothetical protein